MIEVLATNITSPLGRTTEENYRAVRSGRSALRCYENWRDIPARFGASMLSDEQMAELAIEGFTKFESLAIRSIEEALSHCEADPTSPRTIFILSTTKANIDELRCDTAECYSTPGEAAKKIARHFGMTNEPIVVCNACISGVTAQLLADSLITTGEYDTAVVCGADVVSPFVVAGFHSFKSLSPEACRPFDIERLGLNLGEAASTIIFGRMDNTSTSKWRLMRGYLNNDAYHVSAPSPVGEGTVTAISKVMTGEEKDSLGVVCVHGTATMFNDQMESKAIERGGLSEIPICAIKGYYGHTLGAAGVLETVLTMRASDEGVVLAVRGFDEIGVSGKINISNQERSCTTDRFLKIISGFGGCNGVLLYSKEEVARNTTEVAHQIKCTHTIRITPNEVVLDDKPLMCTTTGGELLKELYKTHIGDYPKFYKMDTFSRLALIATDLLVGCETMDERAVEHDLILFNRSSSIVADRNHLATISDTDNFYPSPSVFLYTLPNIATGEIAIKHSFKGETSLYILEHKSEPTMKQITTATMQRSDNPTLITGWIDCESENQFEAEIKILTKQ